MRGHSPLFLVITLLLSLITGCGKSGGSSNEPSKHDIDNPSHETSKQRSWSNDVALSYVSGYLLAAWIDNRNGDRDVFFNVKNSGNWVHKNDIKINGISGGRTVATSGGTDASSVSIAASRPDPKIPLSEARWVYVAWSDNRDGHQGVYFNRSDNLGQNFQGEMALNKSWPFSNRAEDVYICCGSDGKDVYVLWSDGFEVYINHSDNYGENGSWKGEERVTKMADPMLENSRKPKGAVSSDGSYCHVVWSERGALFYRRMQNHAWIEGERDLSNGLPNDTYYFINPDIACWGNDATCPNIEIVWLNGNIDAILLSSTDNGATFPASQIINDVNNAAFDPHMACNLNNNTGNLCVVWEERIDSGNKLWQVKANARVGGAFQPTAQTFSSIYPDYKASHPRIAYYGDETHDEAHIVWIDYQNNYDDTYHSWSSDGGINWQPAQQLNPSGLTVYSDKQTVVCDESGNAYVGWIEKRSKDDVTRVYGCDPKVTGLPNEVIPHQPKNNSHGWKPVVTSNGSSFFVAWLDDRNGASDIYFTYSHDGGYKWSTATLVNSTAGRFCANPCIVSDIHNNVYIVWEELERRGWQFQSRIYYKKFTFSKDGTFIPSDVTRNNWIVYDGVYPKITCTNNGHVYVVWLEVNWLGTIWFAESSNFGEDWFGRKSLEGTSNESRNTNMCALDDGHIYVVWKDSLNISFKVSSDYGLTWDAEIEIDGTSDPCEDPQIACNDNYVYVTWTQYQSDIPTIYFSYSADSGANWSTPSAISGAGETCGNPKITATNSVIGVTWMRFVTPDKFRVYANTANSANPAAWHGQERLDKGSIASLGPVITSLGNNAFVAWDQGPKILTRRWNSGAWEDEEEVTTDSNTLAIEPRITVTQNWRFFAWSDYRDGKKRIFVENREQK